MKSPSKEDVVKCLKSTPKGRLVYRSGSGGTFAPVSKSSRRVSLTDFGLIVALSSPPDQRNSESLTSLTNTDGYCNDRSVQGGSNESKDRAKENGPSSFKSRIGQERTLASHKPRLHVSTHDVIDLINEYKQELGEKAKKETKIMKEKFLAGFQQIQNEVKCSEIEANRIKIANFQREANEIDQILARKTALEEESLKSLKMQHKRRSLSLQSFNESIQKRQEEIIKQREEQEEAKQRRKALSQNIESLLLNIKKFCLEINEQIKCHIDNDYLPDEIKKLSNDAIAMFQAAAKRASSATEMQITLEETCSHLEKLAQSLKMIKDKVSKETEIAVAKKKEEENKRQAEKKEKEAKDLEQQRLENKNKIQDSQVTLDSFVAAEAFKGYQEIVEFHGMFKASYSALVEGADKKTYRFDLTKAINTPINAISDHSPHHLMDKIERLTKLLNGEMTTVGNKNVSCKDQPEGLAYCKDTIAKKLVLQGTRQISSSFNSAFSFGAVAVGIWAQFPEVGKLMLAHFYTTCPYLVPYYLHKGPDQSVAEYCKKLGYEVNGEDIEDENTYLKKLSGIVRLYAAILQSPLPPKYRATGHPFGLHNAWTWISRIMNLEPRETVTATILFDFLEVAAYAMKQKYGKQFQKLLRMLYEDFLPKIDDITESDKKGPVVRLKTFIQKCAETGSVPVPQGYLSSRWWNG
eukprot:gene1870-16369_t